MDEIGGEKRVGEAESERRRGGFRKPFSIFHFCRSQRTMWDELHFTTYGIWSFGPTLCKHVLCCENRNDCGGSRTVAGSDHHFVIDATYTNTKTHPEVLTSVPIRIFEYDIVCLNKNQISAGMDVSQTWHCDGFS